MSKQTRAFIIAVVIFLVITVMGSVAIWWYRRPVIISNRTVSVSIYPLYDVTKAIVGDTADVALITPFGTEPHEYVPTAQDRITIEKSQLFVYNGLGIDPWTGGLVDEIAKKGVVTLNSSDGVAVERAKAANNTQTSTYDPHIWLSPVNVSIQANHIRDSIISVYPEHKDEYTARAQAYIDKLTELDTQLSSSLATCQKRQVVVAHDAYEYLAQRYNIETKSVFGLAPEDAPSISEQDAIVSYIKDNKIDVIFYEESNNSKLIETIARRAGVTLAAINPIETITEKESQNGINYLSLMGTNKEALQKALICQ